MRVLFINPGLKDNIPADLAPAVDQARGPLPPLGLLYVMGYLERAGGHCLGFLDVAAEGPSPRQLEDRIRAFNPGIAGITVNTFTLIDALAAARAVRRAAPGCRVVFGGPHAHLYPRETLGFSEVDYLVLGEGEVTFHRLVRALEEGRDPLAVPGVAGRRGDDVHWTAPPSPPPLDDIPLPARHLTPWRRYASVLGRERYMTTMMTSRGCPFHCVFCHRPVFARRFSVRSAENVVDELEACVRLGIQEFQVYDDTFTADARRVGDICRLIGRRGLDISLDIRARVDTVDEAMLTELRRAGCSRIRYGVEAASDRVLRALNKQITVDQVRRAVRATRRAGIETLAYFMLGSPGETRRDVLATIRFARELDADYAVFSVTTPFPATELYSRAMAEGRIADDVWARQAARPDPGFSPPCWEEHMRAEELRALAARAYRSFYLRPGYVWRRLRGVGSLRELGRKAQMALKVAMTR